MNQHPGIQHLKPSRRFPKGGWVVRYRDPDNRTLRKTFPTQQEARDFQAAIRTDKNRGDFIDPRKAQTRFREVAEDWYASKASRLKVKTRAGYRYILDAHVLPAFGDKPIGRITPPVLRSFLAQLESQKPGTRRNILRVVGSILYMAVDDGMIRTNPARSVSVRDAVGKPNQQKMYFLEPDQVATLADTMPSREHRTHVLFAAYTGCRAGEIMALRVRHLSLMDLNKARVTVEESVSEVHGQLHFVAPKNYEIRSMAIPRFLAELLVEQTAGKDRDDFVFAGAKEGPQRHSHFYERVFKPAVRSLDIPDIRFHDLRHTCVAILIDNGEHPKAIQERLGHKSIQVTLDRYGHLFKDHEADMMKRLQKTFAKAKPSNNGAKVIQLA